MIFLFYTYITGVFEGQCTGIVFVSAVVGVEDLLGSVFKKFIHVVLCNIRLVVVSVIIEINSKNGDSII